LTSNSLSQTVRVCATLRHRAAGQSGAGPFSLPKTARSIARARNKIWMHRSQESENGVLGTHRVGVQAPERLTAPVPSLLGAAP
jgi:hypothetical protein